LAAVAVAHLQHHQLAVLVTILFLVLLHQLVVVVVVLEILAAVLVLVVVLAVAVDIMAHPYLVVLAQQGKEMTAVRLSSQVEINTVQVAVVAQVL
jgi:hypothetical protein